MNKFARWLMPLLWLALGISFGVDFINTVQGGSIDLRNRITGERILENHLDAYHYKWQESEPPEFCDVYNNPQLPVSKTTATPALLMLHMPLAALPYRIGQFSWLFLQWLLLLGTMWLWLRLCATPQQRLLLVLFITGFTYTAAWRLHAERGQAYVLLLFLFAAWLSLTFAAKHGNSFWTGLLAGVLVALRPPFLLLAPFLVLHRRGQLLGMGAGLLLGFGLPLLINSSCWSDYYSAIQIHSNLYRNGIDPRPGPHAYPPVIEDIPTDILGKYAEIPYADSSIFALLRWFGFDSFPALPLLLALAMPFVLWLWLSRHHRPESLLAGIAAWFFLADLFLPAFRNSYNDVLILNVIALGLIGTTRFPWPAWACALALPIGLGIYAFVPDQAWLINLPTLLFILSAILFLFLFNNDRVPRKT
ncbi:MAG: glycosyltransferase 87 family protein [Methylacidiphilales bacterium]|nr:glycosyltransferase 87 family protein [Candidatus Methylacidiphilales bacterium]